MRPPPPPPESSVRSLDDFVEAFEEALAQQGRADLAAFLPEVGHPLHTPVLAELIRVDLEHGWEHGSPLPLEDYRRRFPAFFTDPDNVAAVAFEEYRLRRQAGQTPSPAEYECAYGIRTDDWPPPRQEDKETRRQGDKETGRPESSLPVSLSPCLPVSLSSALEEAAHAYREFRWLQEQENGSVGVDSWLQAQSGGATHARVFGDLHRADPSAAERLADGLVRMPEVGTEFLGFRLLAELGRGAFGRVFLAEQAALANRLVALKVAPDAGGESQKLAQLQHTHIVPVYSLHRADPLQAVCMPFFGALTLADVLRDVSARPSLPQSGKELLSTLNERQSQVHTQRNSAAGAVADGDEVLRVRASPDATLKKLQGLSYVEAVLWLGGCLADGLGHAHERGIYHRDLKPANVLLTDEGQPMLLDFNLSEDTKQHPGAAAALVGGTLPYMAPEHLEAFRGRSRSVDGRSDLFSLGILLYELLAGQPPYPRLAPPATGAEVDAVVDRLLEDRRRPPPPARLSNAAVSPAIDSILRRCLEADPEQRYQSARHLQEDLQRQLEALPLKYAREASLRERLRKLVRRSPKLVSRSLIVLALVTLALAAGFGIRTLRQKQEVTAHAREIQLSVEATAVLRTTEKDIADARFLLNSPLGRERPEETEKACRRVLDRYGVEREDWRAGNLFRPLNSTDRNHLEGEIGELLFLLARHLTRSGAGAVRLEEVLRLNREAERCFAEDGVPPSARGYYLRAGQHTAAGRYRQALPLLEKAAALTPKHYWTWFLLGQCHDGLNQGAVAVARYDVCVALAPDFHGGYFNRGVAHLRQRNWKAALADFDRVLQLKGGFADAYLNRALAHRGLGQPKDEAEDLNRALQLAPTRADLYFLRARARRNTGDVHGADRDRAEGLRLRPRDVRSWNALGLDYLYRGRQLRLLDLFDAAAALLAFESGLSLAPDDLSCLRNKAHVLADRLDRQREALAVQDRIVRLFPEFAEGLAGRAVLEARLGNRAAAHRDAREALLHSPDRHPFLVYQAGDVYALTSRQVADDALLALPLLHEALRRGFGDRHLASDPDLRPLHHLPEFGRLRELAFHLSRPPRGNAP